MNHLFMRKLLGFIGTSLMWIILCIGLIFIVLGSILLYIFLGLIFGGVFLVAALLFFVGWIFFSRKKFKKKTK